MERDLQAFREYIANGGNVEATDWMPDDYRERVAKIVGFQGLAEVVGSLIFAEWLPKVPSLQRKLIIAAKIQDEIGHAVYMLRICEDLGKSREKIMDDYFKGKSRLLYNFHFAIEDWYEWPLFSVLGNMGAILQFQSLMKSSYLPYQRGLKRILKEEAFHYQQGYDLLQTLMTEGNQEQKMRIQKALNRIWPIIKAYFGPPDAHNWKDSISALYRLKCDSNDHIRNQWLSKVIPLLDSFGLTPPDNLRFDESTGIWSYDPIDWNAVMEVVKNGGPDTERIRSTIEKHYKDYQWVRDLVKQPV
jgi:ring-1,2-phenylacetyl-CoA epoxidase subunit PaaA